MDDYSPDYSSPLHTSTIDASAICYDPFNREQPKLPKIKIKAMPAKQKEKKNLSKKRKLVDKASSSTTKRQKFQTPSLSSSISPTSTSTRPSSTNFDTRNTHFDRTFNNNFDNNNFDNTFDNAPHIPHTQNDQQVPNEEHFYWKNELSLVLIDAYITHKDKFTNVRYKSKKIWELISEDVRKEMVTRKYTSFPTDRQCDNRWKTMTRTFRKTCDHNNKSGNDRRECPFMDQIAHAYGVDRPNVRPVATSSSLSGTIKNNNSTQLDNSSDDEFDEEEEEEGVAEVTKSYKQPVAKKENTFLL